MFLGAIRPLAAFCGGSLCAFFLCLCFSFSPFLGAGISLLFFFLFLFIPKVPKLFKTLAILFLGLAFGLIWCGAFDLFYTSKAASFDGKTQIIDITVTETEEYGLIGYTHLGSHRLKLYLSYYHENKVSPGDLISAEVAFSLPTYQGGFDGERYYYSNGIFLLAKLTDSDSVSVSKEYSVYYTILGNFRQWANQKADLLFASEAGSLKALLLGNRDALSDEQKDQLSGTGLSHTFVVSGMHLSFLTGVLSFAAALHPLMWIPVLLIVCLYAALTGFGLSVIRAFLMLLYQKIGDFFELQPDPVTSLFLTLFLILLPNPYSLLNAGLIFSYLAVAGILFLKPWLTDMFYYPLLLHSPYETSTKRMKTLLSSLTTSLSAGAATLPAAAFYMGNISFIFLPANLLLLFPVTFCFYTGLLALFLFFLFPPVGRLLAIPAKWMLSLFWDADSVLFSLPHSRYGLHAKSFLIYLCLAALFLFFLAIRKKRLFHPISIGLLICGFLMTSIYTSVSDMQYDCTMTCLSSKQPCALLTVCDVNFLIGYDPQIDSLLQENNIVSVDYFIPLSYEDFFPSSDQYAVKIQEPCSVTAGDITVSLNYQGNVLIAYRDLIMQLLASPGSVVPDADLLFITSDIISNSDMNYLLADREAILLGKPSKTDSDHIVLTEIPYQTGDLLISFYDRTFHFE